MNPIVNSWCHSLSIIYTKGGNILPERVAIKKIVPSASLSSLLLLPPRCDWCLFGPPHRRYRARKKAYVRLRECWMQVEAEVASNRAGTKFTKNRCTDFSPPLDVAQSVPPFPLLLRSSIRQSFWPKSDRQGGIWNCKRHFLVFGLLVVSLHIAPISQ